MLLEEALKSIMMKDAPVVEEIAVSHRHYVKAIMTVEEIIATLANHLQNIVVDVDVPALRVFLQSGKVVAQDLVPNPQFLRAVAGLIVADPEIHHDHHEALVIIETILPWVLPDPAQDNVQPVGDLNRRQLLLKLQQLQWQLPNNDADVVPFQALRLLRLPAPVPQILATHPVLAPNIEQNLNGMTITA